MFSTLEIWQKNLKTSDALACKVNHSRLDQSRNFRIILFKGFKKVMGHFYGELNDMKAQNICLSFTNWMKVLYIL